MSQPRGERWSDFLPRSRLCRRGRHAVRVQPRKSTRKGKGKRAARKPSSHSLSRKRAKEAATAGGARRRRKAPAFLARADGRSGAGKKTRPNRISIHQRRPSGETNKLHAITEREREREREREQRQKWRDWDGRRVASRCACYLVGGTEPATTESGVGRDARK